jgi:DNA-binding XRE family transcriptional regulator
MAGGYSEMGSALYRSAANRLKTARMKAGYISAKDFARAVGMSVTTYQHHENGRRSINPKIAAVYANVLSTSANFLLFGEELQTRTTARIVGYLVAGGRVTRMLQEKIDIPAALRPGAGERPFGQSLIENIPDPRDLDALPVVGDDLYPAYRNGDVVMHTPLESIRRIDPALQGKECVCELDDGTCLVRTVTIQPDGRATLIGHAVPPMLNARIVAVAPVVMVIRYIPPPRRSE